MKTAGLVHACLRSVSPKQFQPLPYGLTHRSPVSLFNSHTSLKKKQFFYFIFVNGARAVLKKTKNCGAAQIVLRKYTSLCLAV